MQTDKKKLQELSCEVQRKEEWLQEERMERENLEVELGCERDRNRVSTTQSLFFQTQTRSALNITAHVPQICIISCLDYVLETCFTNRKASMDSEQAFPLTVM